MSAYFWKLTESELRNLVTANDADRIIAASRKRKPGKFAGEVVKVPLNKPGTIWVQSIHFYGGENFREPYYFLAEVTHTTSNSAWSRFAKKHGFLRVIPFTY